MPHMPSPWKIEIPTRGPVQIQSRHGLHVAQAWTIDDAQIMAAAPELLDGALKLRCWSCNWWLNEPKTSEARHCTMCQPLRDAIATARGSTDERLASPAGRPTMGPLPHGMPVEACE